MVLVMLSGQVQSLCGLVSTEGLIEAWQEGVVLRTLSDTFTVVEGQYLVCVMGGEWRDQSPGTCQEEQTLSLHFKHNTEGH